MRTRTNRQTSPGLEPLEPRRLFAAGLADPTFGASGLLFDPNGPGAQSMALQADGRIVVAAARAGDVIVSRYQASGALDKSFGVRGRSTIDFGGTDAAGGIAIQPDGKVVVAGTSGSDFAVARLTSSGALDTTFGPTHAGTVVTDFGHAEQGNAVAIQADGKIVVAGISFPTSLPTPEFAVVRYGTDGTLDTAFGAGGEALADTGGRGVASAVTVDASNRVVVAGTQFGGLSSDFAVARFAADGSNDVTFGTAGIALVGSGSFFAANAVALDPAGKLLVGGTATDNAALARLNTDGTLDTAFGTAGIVTTKLGGASGASAAITAVAVAPTGKVIVAGSSGLNAHRDFAVARFTANGGTDATFGNSGVTTSDFAAGDDAITAAALQPDGRLVVAGASNGSLALARYQADAAQSGAGPTAALTSALRLRTPNIRHYGFVVIYGGAKPIDTTSLDGNDLVVTGPGGFSASAQLFSVDNRRNGAPRVATYVLTGPGGLWDAADDGLYTIHLLAGQVRDTSGNAAADQVLGQFTVRIP